MKNGHQLRGRKKLTIVSSLLLEALSAMLAASGGVRWPSQVATRNEMAEAPISMAWPEIE